MEILRRLTRHLLGAHRRFRGTFPPEAFDAIEKAVAEAERGHEGEIRLVVEAHLGLDALLVRRKTPRERALEVFSQLRVWDTEKNCGVLIYLLLADRDVEIVADRGINALTGAARWEEICREMEASFARGEFEQGAVRGITLVGAELARHFPSSAERDELPNRPVSL